MRVLVFVKATEDSEAGIMPEQTLLEDMMNYNEQLVKAGIMKGGEGLKPTKEAVRIRFSGESRMVTDGPFAETKEQVAGYWIWEVNDMDEAIAWVKKCPNPMSGDSDIDIRPAYEMGDFGDIVTDEVRGQADRLDAEMAARAVPPRQVFVNLPVADLVRSRQFFAGLGFAFDEKYCDDTAACMVLTKDIYAMLLTKDKFRSFSPNPVSDASKANEVLNALSCVSREEVDDLVAKAEATGGRRYSEPKDYGFMYQHGFQDPDGHVWELVYMRGESGSAT